MNEKIKEQEDELLTNITNINSIFSSSLSPFQSLFFFSDKVNDE